MRKGFKQTVKIFSAGLFCLLCHGQLSAQHSGTNPTGALVNYVRTWDATAPEQDPNTLMNRLLKDVKQATQYIDGLGRPLQTVIKQGSLVTGQSPTDMVSPVEYDAYGREQYKWMPYKSPGTDGLFKQFPFTEQVAFYNTQLTGQAGETNVGANSLNWAYSKTNFEASPLNRVTDTYAPGSSWAGSETSIAAQQRNLQMKYAINTPTDAVRIWTVTDNPTIGVFGTYSSTPVTNYTAVYDAGQLYKTITTDEHKKQVIEFKDKEGKVILKKVQLTAAADDGTGSGYGGWLCTYYIYDDFNNLRCVIQPEGVKALSQNGWVIDYSATGLAAEQCFRYEYDQRNRMIKKKVPGAGEVWMVYDARDRVVMTQDANMRSSTQQKWMYTQYDDLNRPVATGFITDAAHYTDLNYHLNAAYYSTAYPNLALYTSEELTRTFYNDYTWLSNYSNPLPNSYNSSYNSYFQTASNINWPYPQANVQSAQIKGMPTGSSVKVLGTNTYLYTVMFYDDKGRVIQMQSTNITGGVDITSTQYTWAGQPLVVIQRQEKQGTNTQTSIIVSQLTYDDLGRVIKTEKKVSNTLVNSNAMPAYKTIAQNEYNALGQLKKKNLAPAYNSNAGLETLNYDYNIRGWMLGVNRDYAKDINPSPSANTGNGYFGFDLGYDKADNKIIGNQTYNTPQYNGNIEGMVWKSKGDGEKRKYDFTYDAANRLLKADFTQYAGSIFDQSAGVNFNVKMGDGTFLPDGITLDPTKAYDDNGNIKQMQQWGLKINASAQIDNLSYTYQSYSNKLLSVTDAVTADNKLGDFKDGNVGSDDYAYDVNGNMVIDKNKNIYDGSQYVVAPGITYNYLNLPQNILVYTKGSIEYVYDAAGNKLKKIVHETGKPDKTTVYVGGVVYEDDVLQFVPQEEGRIRFKPAVGNIAASLQYDYMLKDHLGNVRMVLTEEQQKDIYPAVTLEPNLVSTENTFYTIDQSKVVLNSAATGIQNQPAYPNNNLINSAGNPVANNNPGCTGTVCTTDNSQYVYRLNSNSNKTGLGITLKVMAGDKLDVYGKSYYFQNNPGSNYTNTVPILDLLSAFLGGPGAAAATNIHGTVTATQINTPSGTSGINSMMTAQTNQSNGATLRPRAFINVIFFDEQFKAVDNSYRISMVGDNSVIKDHAVDLQNLTVPKNGFVYIYCSNETPVDVFFDNIQVVHNRGAILEETHYYPFGLTMAGISSKAAGGLGNKKKYNGIELNNDFDINAYEAFYRNLDAQIGRWWQIDPKIELGIQDISPYSSMHNNPFLVSDFLGDFDDYKLKQDGNIELIKKTKDKTDKLYATDKQGVVDKNNSIEIDKSVLSKMENLKNIGFNGILTLLKVDNNLDASKKLFEFLSNNSNVEFGIVNYTRGSSYTGSIISTSHSQNELQGNKIVINSLWRKINILEANHSHPGNEIRVFRPSGFDSDDKPLPILSGDRAFAKELETLVGKQVVEKVYLPAFKSYIRYDSSQLYENN